MQIAPRQLDALTAAGACLLAIGLGAVLHAGGLAWIAATVGITVFLFAVIVGISAALDDPTRIPFALAAVGIALASANGVRVSQFTAGDVLLLASAPVYLVLLRRLPRLPTWLWAGAGLITASALLIALFPPPLSSSELFRQKNLTSGQVAQEPHLVLAARLLLAVIVIPAVIAVAASTANRLRWLVTFWVVGTALGAFIAVLAAFGPVDLQQTITGQAYTIEAYKLTQGRYTGLSVHPTLLGVAAAMACPVVIGRMTDVRKGWIYSPVFAVLVLAVLVSGSRIALIAAIVGMAVVFVYQHRTRRQALAIAAAAGLLLTFTGSAASGLSTTQRLFKDAGGVESAASSDASRSRTIREGIELFQQRPIGWGYQGLRGAHNVLIQILSGGGLLLLLGMGLVVGGAMVAGWRLRAEADAVGLLASVVVVLVAGTTTNAVFDRFLSIPVGLLVGLSLVALQSQTIPDETSGIG